MKNIPLSEILTMSVAERIALIELIWDSIDAEPGFGEMTDELRAELDRRIANVEANPGVGRTWREIEARLLALE
ncbi:MAG TPA: addiction module protein [Longimicrobium sp.]|jgi:putative addiction module component (TIGR02574 family)